MIDITIEGREVSIPTRWDDLTWGQVKGLPEKPGDMAPMPDGSYYSLNEIWLEYFTGESDILNRFPGWAIIQWGTNIAFLYANPDWRLDEYSGAFVWDGKEYFVMDDITQMKGSAYLNIFKLIAEEQKGDPELFSRLVAFSQMPPEEFDIKAFIRESKDIQEKITKLLFDYTIFGKDFDPGRAMKMDLDSMKFREVYLAASFFLKPLAESKSGTGENARTQSGQAKRSKPGIMKFLRNTVLS